MRTSRLGKYLIASSLSVALMVCSICSRVTPSMVVGICVGSDVGWPPVMVTTPRFLVGASVAWATVCACAETEKAMESVIGKAMASATAIRVFFMGAPLKISMKSA